MCDRWWKKNQKTKKIKTKNDDEIVYVFSLKVHKVDILIVISCYFLLFFFSLSFFMCVCDKNASTFSRFHLSWPRIRFYLSLILIKFLFFFVLHIHWIKPKTARRRNKNVLLNGKYSGCLVDTKQVDDSLPFLFLRIYLFFFPSLAHWETQNSTDETTSLNSNIQTTTNLFFSVSYFFVFLFFFALSYIVSFQAKNFYTSRMPALLCAKYKTRTNNMFEAEENDWNVDKTKF